MPKLDVKKSIQINAPKEKIFKTLNDFNHWTKWSPWLIMDPNAKVAVSDDGKYYEWEGERVGSGNMNVIHETPDESIDYDLTFLKPWKSKSKVRFELKEEGKGIKVTWLMDSRLPFFMFWMKRMMTEFIGMDYERGLAMLKDYVEDGEVHSKLHFKGISHYDGCTYIGVKTDCTLDEVGPKMQEDLTKIGAYLEKHQDKVAGEPFSIYHKWDMVGKKVSYTSGVPVTSVPEDLPEDMISGSIPSTKVYTLEHVGQYAHLGNAWSTMYNMHRGKVFKPKKGIHPFEVYKNNPGEVPDDELVTEVNFAVK